MNDILIRKADLNEHERIAGLKMQIHNLHVNGRPDLFNPITDMHAFAENAAGKNCSLLLAECADEVVGYAMYQIVDRPQGPYMNARRFLHVEEFCVGDSHQRKGIGTQLMDALKEIARFENCPRVELDVWAFNEGAKQFYEACGMRAYRTFMEMEV